MSRYTFLEGLVVNLKGGFSPRSRGYLPKKDAYRQLKLQTGQDFGDDVVAWEKWIRDHPHPIKAVGIKSDAAELIARFLAKGK